MKTIHWVISGALLTAPLFGQAPAERPEFEVASIKAAEPINANGGQVNIGVHVDGAQYHVNSFTLKDYIRIAYRLKDYQIVCPDWAGSDRFDISAKIPAGVPRDKTPEMLQKLLEERFDLKFHNDKKDFPVYALIVTKPEKLKESAHESDEDKAEAAKAPVEVAASGSSKGVNVNYGHGSYVSFSDNKLTISKLAFPLLTDWLTRFLDRPVLDKTGLTGNYDFKIEITPEDYRTMLIRSAVAAGVVLPPEALKLLDNATDESLHSALASYGLKLETRKAPLDVMVVDSAKKVPTAN